MNDDEDKVIVDEVETDAGIFVNKRNRFVDDVFKTGDEEEEDLPLEEEIEVYDDFSGSGFQAKEDDSEPTEVN